MLSDALSKPSDYLTFKSTLSIKLIVIILTLYTERCFNMTSLNAD
jgi:hypothetical protein